MDAPVFRSMVAPALALLITWAAARRRLPPLFLAGALYPLFAVQWQIALGLAAAAELARLASGQSPRWRTPLTAALGLGVGLLASGNLTALGSGGSLSWLDVPGAWPLAGASAVAGAWLAWRRRRLTHLPLAFALPALALGALALRDRAYLALFAAFSLAALTSALETCWRWPTAPRLGP